MKNYLLFVGLLLFSMSTTAQKLPHIGADNPIAQTFIKKALEQAIPKAKDGSHNKIKDINFLKNKKQDGTLLLKGNVIFQNPKAALGNGDYRFKLKMNEDLMKPKIHFLRLQIFRIWFIRFYKRVI